MPTVEGGLLVGRSKNEVDLCGRRLGDAFVFLLAGTVQINAHIASDPMLARRSFERVPLRVKNRIVYGLRHLANPGLVVSLQDIVAFAFLGAGTQEKRSDDQEEVG